MNLHQWITSQVGTIETAARAATLGPWEDVVDDHGHGQIEASVWADGIGYYITEKVTSGPGHIADARHIAANDPTAVLRRCEADRRILARHTLPEPDEWLYPGCAGCGTTGEYDDPVSDNINDCPELLDLAHAHGITEKQFTGLDRPEPARPDACPVIGQPTVTHAVTLDQIPAALRGPRWRRHHH